jgi:hypothetical protein
MEFYSLTVGLGITFGVGLVAHVLLSTLQDLGRKIRWKSHPSRLVHLGIQPASKQDRESVSRKHQSNPSIPWNTLLVFSVFAGMGLTCFLGSSLPAAKGAVILLPLLVWGFKKYWGYQEKRFLLSQVRQFLLDVRLYMSLRGSMLLGLQHLGETTQESTPLYRSLKYHLSGSSARSGMDLLQKIAKDISCPPFSRAIQRIQAAQQTGGISDIDLALAQYLEELNEEIGYQTEEQMQRLPTRITLLAMPLLLGPIVILLFYPLVDRILHTLSGVGIGGGF